MELKKKEYGEYVEKITPKNSLPADMARAFLTGGAICSLGQAMIMVQGPWYRLQALPILLWLQP